MIKFGTLVLITVFFSVMAKAQTGTIKGLVQDNVDKSPIISATVSISLQNDSTHTKIKNVVTDALGGFALTEVKLGNYIITISYVGYDKKRIKLNLAGNLQNLGVIGLIKQGKKLTDVTIIAKAPPVVMKGDTTQFSAEQFKVNPDATTEDLIKKMPTITVAANGTVTAQGETVKKVTVDGKDFFGDDASAALKNLPAEVVDKIQVYDRLSDQAQLTGFDDGNSVKAINIVTKNGVKNGQFGRAYAGYGSDDRYAAGGNMSFFKGNRRLSFVANFNNVNQQNFGSQDLLGLTSSGGGRRGGGPGGGNANNFIVGQSSGISKTNAFGLNYSDQWGKKITITGSYFYNNSTNNNESQVNTETFLNTKNLYSVQASDPVTFNYNHRLNLRLEYKIDSANSIFIIPSLNFQKNNSSNYSTLENLYDAMDTVSTSMGENSANKNGYNLRNNIMYRHAFKKKGRSISMGFNVTYNENNGSSLTNTDYRFFNGSQITDSLQNQYSTIPTSGHTIAGNLAYTEPIGKKGQLQINYTPSVQKNKADQQTFGFDGEKYSKFDTTLSNRFENTITTQNAGATYRLNPSKDEQFFVGINYQNSLLESQRIFPTNGTVNQSFSNLLPNAMWRKKLSSVSTIRIMYRANVNFPSINQLQDVVNLSNPLAVSSGNPDLRQSYTQLLTARYSYVNSKNSQSFFANIIMQTAADYISNATYIANKDTTIQQNIILKKGSQLTKPINLDGYKNLNTFFTYSIPVKPIKTTVNINAGFNYSRLPGQVNYQTTITDNYIYNAGVVFASNISEYVDFNISYNANINDAKTSATTISSSTYINQSVGLQMNLLDKKGWFVNNNITNQSNSGLAAGLNQSYWLWNAAIGKKFLKKKEAELKLSVFDLLKQNQSVSRTVTGSYIQDSRNQVLQQYFMLTFTYSLRNFGVPARPGNFNGEGRDRMFRPGNTDRNF